MGAQCGLKPDEVLDMNLDTFNAVIQGYQDRLFDLECLAVHHGFWSGYYSIRTKRPKPVNSILKTLARNRLKSEGTRLHENDVDVEAFLEREENFKRRWEEQHAGRKQES